jgi:hypothetical protein
MNLHFNRSRVGEFFECELEGGDLRMYAEEGGCSGMSRAEAQAICDEGNARLESELHLMEVPSEWIVFEGTYGECFPAVKPGQRKRILPAQPILDFA